MSGSIVVLLLVSVQLSAEVSTLEEETRTVAESVALLQARVDDLESGRRTSPDPNRDRRTPDS